MHPMLNIAIRAARAAGDLIARSFESEVDIKPERKGDNDYVTKIDKEAEQLIIDKIKQSYPEHSFVGEELGITDGSDDFKWIIDPLDGTNNFVMGIPHFAVSIALMYKGRLDQAVVLDPIRHELFTASKGKGTQMNSYRLRVNTQKDLEGTFLATGFPYKNKEGANEAIQRFNQVYQRCGDVRSTGSSALDLAYVAAGRLDGYWEKGIKPWDVAAGELLVKEAGGLVTDYQGGHEHFRSGEIVAGSPKVVQNIVKLIK